MLFEIGEQVYINGNIMTNKYPRGDIGINDIKTIFANNIKGTVYHIEYPSLINNEQFLYTIKIFENLYAIEVKHNQLSNVSFPINGIYNPLSQSNIFNYNVQSPNLNALNSLEQLNELNKTNWINNQIGQINNFTQNLNTSKNVQKTITKYIYYKLVDDWLYKKLFPILAFVKIINGKPYLISSMKDYDVDRLSTQTDLEIELRAKYLEQNIITKKFVSKVLKKIVKKMCINWYDLDKHQKTIQDVFFDYLKNLLEKSIETL